MRSGAPPVARKRQAPPLRWLRRAPPGTSVAARARKAASGENQGTAHRIGGEQSPWVERKLRGVERNLRKPKFGIHVVSKNEH